METLKNLEELRTVKAVFDRKRAGVLFKRLITNANKHKLNLTFNSKGKVNGFTTIDRKTLKPIKHKVFIRKDKLLVTCKAWNDGNKAWDMNIFIPGIND